MASIAEASEPDFFPLSSLIVLISGRASNTCGELVIKPATSRTGRPRMAALVTVPVSRGAVDIAIR